MDDLPPDDVPEKALARDWSIHVLTALVLILMAAAFYLLVSISAVTSEVRLSRNDMVESKVRGCITLAHTSGFLPPSCLEDDFVGIYARDLIPTLDLEGDQGKNRHDLCVALADIGITDASCRE